MNSRTEQGYPVIPPEARPAARVILLSPDHHILLLRATEDGFDGHWWVMPGGGLQPGERFVDAAVREVLEETGLHVAVSNCVWTRHHVFEWKGKVVNQYERFFVAHTRIMSITPLRQDSYIQEYRWWTLPEIQDAPDRFAPARLGALLSPIIGGHYPSTPFDCGV